MPKLTLTQIKPALPKYDFLSLSAEERKTAESLLPAPMHRCRFTVKACTAIANGFRRVVNDELVWSRIGLKLTDIDTDDEFAKRLTDNIQNRVNLIPCSFVEPNEKNELTLDFHNKTSSPVIVKSGEIKHNIKGFEFARNIDITEIQPNRYIKLKMTIENGVGGTHAGFRAVSSVRYEAADVGKYDSYTGHPDVYELGFDCESFVDPEYIVKTAFATLVDKLEAAASALAEFTAVPHKSAALGVTQIAGGKYRYEFYNETRTLTNLLAYYAYLADTDIPFVMAGDDYPNDKSSLVKISHKNHKEILIAAAKNAIKDIKKL